MASKKPARKPAKKPAKKKSAARTKKPSSVAGRETSSPIAATPNLDKGWMTETTAAEAATAIARAWLDKAGFHEDPTGDSPERIEINDAGWDDGEHYVDVRIYIPALDIEHVVDGTHPDGITVEASS